MNEAVRLVAGAIDPEAWLIPQFTRRKAIATRQAKRAIEVLCDYLAEKSGDDAVADFILNISDDALEKEQVTK
jgi:hypothetical protein